MTKSPDGIGWTCKQSFRCWNHMKFSPMSNPCARTSTLNSSRSQSLIAVFQVTLWNLRTWLLRLSSDCDPVSP